MDTVFNQLRIVGALIHREMRSRFGRSRIGYAWAVLEPIAHVGVMSFVYWAINRRAPIGTSETQFFVTGVLPFFLYQKTALHLGASIRSNRMLLRMPLVNVMDVIVARGILEGITWLSVTMLIIGGLAVTGNARMPDDPMMCAEAAIAVFVLGLGVGMINAVLMTLWKSWKYIYINVTRPLYHFSAIFFFIDNIPPNLRAWLAWNPMVHGVAWFRQGYWSAYATSVLDRSYLLRWSVAAVVLGLCMERVARSRLQSS